MKVYALVGSVHSRPVAAKIGDVVFGEGGGGMVAMWVVGGGTSPLETVSGMERS